MRLPMERNCGLVAMSRDLRVVLFLQQTAAIAARLNGASDPGIAGRYASSRASGRARPPWAADLAEQPAALLWGAGE
jgi:hypothetical protein